MIIKFTFKGRKTGAIGIFETFTEMVEAGSYEAGALKLYDNYEHISIIDFTTKIDE